MTLNLEKQLKDVTLGMTDKILQFPCISTLPEVLYPDFLWWRFRIEHGTGFHNSLLLATYNRTYKKIAENLYRAISEKETDLFELATQERKTLYSVITSHPRYKELLK